MRKIAQRIVPLCVKVFLSHIWAKYFKPLPVYCRITSESGLNRETRNVEVIVSLTSYPARISTVHMTVLTLLNQKIKPDKIILWLAKEQFPSGMNALPKQLLALMDVGLTIKWTHDIRSYKKLIPSLKLCPEAIVITCDDDTFYPPYWLEMLMASYAKYPDCVHCHRGHTITFNENGNVMPFLKWDFESTNTKPSVRNFQTGIGGVLYPPHCLDAEVFNEQTFMELARTCDDHWFWAMAVLKGTKIKVVNDGIRKCLVNYKASTKYSLCKVNTGADMQSNDDRVFAVLCEKYNLLEKVKNDT